MCKLFKVDGEIIIYDIFKNKMLVRLVGWDGAGAGLGAEAPNGAGGGPVGHGGASRRSLRNRCSSRLHISI